MKSTSIFSGKYRAIAVFTAIVLLFCIVAPGSVGSAVYGTENEPAEQSDDFQGSSGFSDLDDSQGLSGGDENAIDQDETQGEDGLEPQPSVKDDWESRPDDPDDDLATDDESLLPVTEESDDGSVGVLGTPGTTGTISGKVTDASGNPLENITVSLYYSYVLISWPTRATYYGRIDNTEKTNAAGDYSFSGLELKTYKVSFSSDDYTYPEQFYSNAAVEPKDGTSVIVKSTDSVKALSPYKMLGWGGVTGTVSGDSTGLANIRAIALRQSGSGWFSAGGATVNPEDGTFAIPQLHPGTYKLQFYDNNYDSRYYANRYWGGSYSEYCAATFTVTRDNVKSLDDTVLQKGGSISGTVTDGLDGSPLEFTYVIAGIPKNGYLTSPNFQTDTASDGKYSFSGLAPGNYKIEFHGPNGEYQVQYYNGKGTLASGNSVAVTLGNETKDINASMTESKYIYGVVTNNEGAPIAGAQIMVRRGIYYSSHGYGLATNEFGEYKVKGLYPGVYDILVIPPDDSTYSHTLLTNVTFNANENLEKDFRLESNGGTILGTISPKGDPNYFSIVLYTAETYNLTSIGKANLQIRTRHSSETPDYEFESGADLNYSFPNLAPGNYLLAIEKYPNSEYYDGASALKDATPIKVRSGQQTTINYSFASGSTESYIVTFDPNGGSINEEVSEKIVKKGMTVGTLPSAPSVSRSGYTLAGWYTGEPEIVGGVPDGSQIKTSTKPTGNITYYAKWIPKTYTLQYNANGGDSLSPASKAIALDAPYGALPTPTRNGQHFDGWYTSAPATIGENPAGDLVTPGAIFGSAAADPSNLIDGTKKVIYAKWSPAAYKVTWNPNGGAVSPNYTMLTSSGTKFSDSTEVLPVPTRKGYDFKGWYEEKIKDGARPEQEAITIDSPSPADHLTYYAYWENHVSTITFDANRGEVVPPTFVDYNKAIGTLPVPTRTGHQFLGWYPKVTNGTVSGTKLTEKIKFTVDATYYAKWIQGVKVTWVTSGGIGIADTTWVKPGTAVGTLPIPTQANDMDFRAFSGWYTAAPTDSGPTGSKIKNTTVVPASKTFYSFWEPAYKITWNANGGKVNDADTELKFVKADAKVGTLPKTPVRDGYSFVGWFENTGAIATQGDDPNGLAKVTTSTAGKSASTSITYYAKWKAKKYTVTYNANGGSSTTKKPIAYGDNYALPTVPTRVGYDFEGWYTGKIDGSEITSAGKHEVQGNIQYFARWTPKVYTSKFYANDGLNATGTELFQTYGAIYVTPVTDPVWEGHVFLGWFTKESNGSQIKGSVTKVTSATINVRDAEPTSFYAHWDIARAVTWNLNGGLGSTPENRIVRKGTAVGTLPIPAVWENHAFLGWFVSPDNGATLTGSPITSKTKPAADVTYYAKWATPAYLVTWNANSGKIGGETTVGIYAAANAAVGTLPIAPVRAGYKFAGWFEGNPASPGENPTGSKKIDAKYNPNLGGEGTITFYAKWTENTYKVTLNGNGGTPSSQKITYSPTKAPVVTLPTPTRKGAYIFLGWYTTKSGTGDKVDVTYLNSNFKTQTVYARWA